MTYRIQITVDGTIYPVRRDVTHRHPQAVHTALRTKSEVELQAGLDTLNVTDWYGRQGQHLGPDDSGLEMFDDRYYAEPRGGETWEIFGPLGRVGSVEASGNDMDDILAAAHEAGVVPTEIDEICER